MFVLALGVTAALRAQEAPIWSPQPYDDREGRAGVTNWTESPIKAEIEGYLRFAQGKGTPKHVLVKLVTSTGTLFAETWTGTLGEFTFSDIPCASFVVAVDAPGYTPIRKEVEHSYAPVNGVILYLVPNGRETSSTAVEPLPIPDKARKEFQRGLQALGRRQIDRSAGHFRKAIEIYPNYEEAYIQLAWANFQQRAYDQAQRILQKAISVNAKNANAYALLGSAYRAENRIPEAIGALKHSLSLEEFSWFAHLELGQILLKQGKVEEAYSHLVRAHDLNPQRPLTHIALYNALILRNDNGDALAELKEFLKLFPDNRLAPGARKQQAALEASIERQQASSRRQQR